MQAHIVSTHSPAELISKIRLGDCASFALFDSIVMYNTHDKQVLVMLPGGKYLPGGK